MRDSLSLFDQAIAHAAGTVRADDVRQMLGLADRTRVIDLFEHLARGDIASAFGEFREQYDIGADPVVVLSDLAEFVNFVTRVKIVPATADNVAFGETERVRGREFAAKLSMRVLSRMWQMLLKGITEVQTATRPAAAAEMVLVRIAYVADLPTPDEAIRMLEQNGGGSPVVSGGAAPSRRCAARAGVVDVGPSPMRTPCIAPLRRRSVGAAADGGAVSPNAQSAPALRINNFSAARRAGRREARFLTKAALEADMRLVRIEDGRLEVALERNAARGAGQRSLAQAGAVDRPALDRDRLQRGRPADAALAERAGAENEHARAAEADPRVQEVLARCPAPKSSKCAGLPPSRRRPILTPKTRARFRRRRRLIGLSRGRDEWLIFSA